MSKNVGYVRVSTIDQNEKRQLDGIKLDKTFTDKASGKDTNRPQLQQMLSYVREGDMIHVHSFDRLARNLEDLRKIVHSVTNKGVTITFKTENLTFKGDDNAISKLLLSVMGAFSEFERELIKERQREGIELAKKRGAYRGRKKVLTKEQETEIMYLCSKGVPKTRVAKKYNVSRETIYNCINSCTENQKGINK